MNKYMIDVSASFVGFMMAGAVLFFLGTAYVDSKIGKIETTIDGIYTIVETSQAKIDKIVTVVDNGITKLDETVTDTKLYDRFFGPKEVTPVE